MTLYHVYALIDPTDRQIRYVGISRDPNKRLYRHCHNPGKCTSEWIQGLRARGLQPEIFVLDAMEVSHPRYCREQEWITILIGKYPLLNHVVVSHVSFWAVSPVLTKWEKIRHLLDNANVRPAVVSADIPKDTDRLPA